MVSYYRIMRKDFQRIKTMLMCKGFPVKFLNDCVRNILHRLHTLITLFDESYKSLQQCFSTVLLQRNLRQMFALLMEPYAMIQVSILLQPRRTMVANFVPGNFGLFWRNSDSYSQNHEVQRNPG